MALAPIGITLIIKITYLYAYIDMLRGFRRILISTNRTSLRSVGKKNINSILDIRRGQ